MKTAYLENNVVREIIPDYALPVEKFYGSEFASHCMEAPDEVEQGWVYQNGEWAAPSEDSYIPPSDPTQEQIDALKAENTLLKARLQAQIERSDLIEDCIAEMAMQVYAE